MAAVKQLDASRHHDERETAAYLHEINMMRGLDHPNVVRYFCASLDKEHALINVFMELVAGGSLAKLVGSIDGILPDQQGAEYVRQIVCGVSYLHAAAVCKISDFGSSKHSYATAAGAMLTIHQ
eukprot:gene29392-61588_t